MLEILQQPAGQSAFYFTQTLMFAMMVYILIAEYVRTKRQDLVYKLFAASSITLMNLLTAMLYFAEGMLSFKVSDAFYPLIFNAVFALVVLSLSKAFIYEFIENKKVFDILFRLNIGLVILGYAALQYYWPFPCITWSSCPSSYF